MAEHLVECTANGTDYAFSSTPPACICKELRACQRRVETEANTEADYQQEVAECERAATLKEASEAVTAKRDNYTRLCHHDGIKPHVLVLAGFEKALDAISDLAKQDTT